MSTTEPKSWDQILAEGTEIEVDGESYDIKPLTVDDWAEFAAWVRKRQCVELRDNATVLALMPMDKARAAVEIMRHPFGDTEILEHTNTPEGARWVLERALKNANSKGAPLGKMHHMDRANKANYVLQLSGIVRWPNFEETKQEDEQPDPTAELTGE